MSNEAERFLHATGADKFEAVNHNERDFQSYRDFQQEIDKTYREVEKATARAERAANLKKWVASLAPPWSEAKLSTLKDQKAAKAAEAVIKDKKLTSFYLKGKGGGGKTFLALAIVRRYIGLGWLLPSQVKHTSEADILALSRSGFRYNENINNLLHRRYRAFIVDNVGEKKAYTDDELALWGTFLDHLSRRGHIVIFTSRYSSREFSEKLTESSRAKFSFLVNERVVTLSGSITPPEVREDPLTDIGTNGGDDSILAWD